MLLPELVALDTYRVSHDLTWTDLARVMKSAGHPMPARTLHYLCRRSHQHARMLDRTLFKIRAFLKAKRIPVGRSAEPLEGSVPTHPTRHRAPKRVADTAEPPAA
jgi:hypothetical protein